MASYTDIDLSFSPDGDLVIDETGDLAVSVAMDCTRDDIDLHLKTQQGDFAVWPGVGADLETFMGMPMSSVVGDAVVTNIITALVSNGVVNPADIKVSVMPIGSTLLCYIIVDPGNGEEIRTSFTVELGR